MINSFIETKTINVISISALAACLILAPSMVGAQEETEEEIEEFEEELEEYEEELKEYDEELNEDDEELEEEKAISMPPMPPIFHMKTKKISTDSPRFGVYLEDLDFEDVYEKHYPYNYGVLITSVVRGGSAHRAGLRGGDIIMEFDGEKARFEDHLIRMRNSKSIGDTVEIKFFRDEKVMTTNLIFYPPKEVSEKAVKEISRKKKRLSPGFGGGGFEPISINFDFAGINRFLENNGFDKIDDGYVIALGGGGSGNVGKGWFLGGMGGGFERHQKISVKDSIGNTVGARKYKLEYGFGGATITKKFPLLTERMVLDIGIMLGGGGTTLEVSQTDGDFSWEDKIGEGNSQSVRYDKGYFVYRPSVGLLVRIKNWFGIHGSVGYLGTYSSDDKWTEESFKYSVEEFAGGSSPKVPSGLSYSLGIWFGY